MSKNRKWIVSQSYGSVGTDSSEEVDILDEFGWSEEDLEAMSDEEVQTEVDKYAWEMAIQSVESAAEPAD